MAAAILNSGLANIRIVLQNLTTFVGISNDTTAFNATQTLLNPTGGAYLIRTGTVSSVDFQTYDSQMTITGNNDFTNTGIFTIGSLFSSGSGNCLSRSVRGAGLQIGVQSGDVFTIGVRWQVTDAS